MKNVRIEELRGADMVNCLIDKINHFFNLANNGEKDGNANDFFLYPGYKLDINGSICCFTKQEYDDFLSQYVDITEQELEKIKMTRTFFVRDERYSEINSIENNKELTKEEYDTIDTLMDEVIYLIDKVNDYYKSSNGYYIDFDSNIDLQIETLIEECPRLKIDLENKKLYEKLTKELVNGGKVAKKNKV